MPKKIKLKLNDLNVESFTTNTDLNANGGGLPTMPCASNFDYCTENPNICGSNRNCYSDNCNPND